MSAGTILVIVIVIILIGGVAPGPWQGPNGPYWGFGYYGGGGLGLIFIILLILLLSGRL